MADYLEQDIRPQGGSSAAFTVPLGSISDNVQGGNSSSAPKPKQPFLRRGTGLQKRILDSQEKRYIPRGGFITDMHDVGDIAPLGKGGLKSGASARGRTRPTTAGASKTAAARKPASRGPSPAPRRPAASGAAKPSAATRPSAMPARGASAAARPQQPASKVGTAATARQRTSAITAGPRRAAAAQEDARLPSSRSSSWQEEEPAQAGFGGSGRFGRTGPTQQHSWKDEPASPEDRAQRFTQDAVSEELEDFEQLERQAASEQAAHASAAPAAGSRMGSRRNSITSWDGEADAAPGHQFDNRQAANNTARQQHQHDNEFERPDRRPLPADSSATGFDDDSHLARRPAKPSALEQLASQVSQPSPARDSPPPKANGYAHASGYSHHRWQEDSDCEEEGLDHVEATLAAVHRMAPVAAPACMKTLRPGYSKPKSAPQPDPEKEALKEEVARLRGERGRVKALKAQLERSVTALHDQRTAFLKQQDEERAKWEAEKAAQMAKLRRDKLTLEKQSRAILKLPTKKERSELEEVQALLEHERNEGKAREQRHKLTVDRLRRQIQDLQEKMADTKEELSWHVAQRQKERGGQGNSIQQGPAAPASPQPSQRTAARSPGRNTTSERIAEGWRHAYEEAAADLASAPKGGQARRATWQDQGDGGMPASSPEHDGSNHASAQRSAFNHSSLNDRAAANPLYDDDGPSGPIGQMGRFGNRDAAAAMPSLSSQPHASGRQQGGYGAEFSSSDHNGDYQTSISAEWQWRSNGSGSGNSQGARWHNTNGEAPQRQWDGQPPARQQPRHDRPAAAPRETEYTDTVHMDGKRERHFVDGRRMVVFVNGTVKEEYPSGLTIVRFVNGDIKKAYKNGLVEYLYAEVDTWHTTCSDGTQVFHFASGQAEAHRPNGSKEVLFPDGAGRLVAPDGSETDVAAEQLCAAVRAPAPTNVPAIVV